MRSRAIVAACGLGCAGLAATASAATMSSSFNVTVTVVKQCSVTAPPTINFGSLGAAAMIGTTMQQSQNFAVMCSAGTPYTIQFTSPNDATAGSTTHQMVGTPGSNTNVIQYNIAETTSGAANLLPLGGAGSAISGIGIGSSQSRTLQVTVLSPTTALAPDTYTDTVTMSMTY